MLCEKDVKRIEELKNENEELERLFETIEEEHRMTISGVSHELRNILALVVSSMQFIQSSHTEVKDFRYWSETMNDLNYIHALLLELSDYNNSHLLHLKTINLTEFVRQLYLSCLPWFECTDKHLTLKVEHKLPNIQADPSKLHQALLNIIKNAFEAIGETGTVTISTSCRDHQVSFIVNDNGIGISKEQMGTIFSPFVTYKKDGSGLGLSITKRIIETHKGIIDYSSSLGEYTTCTITLPIE